MNRLKKWSTLVLALLMLLTSVPVTPVLAAEENPYEQYVGKASFTVSTAFCAAGGTAKIFVDISGDSQMSAALFVLKYNTDMLKATNVDTGVVLKNGHTSKNITEAGLVKVSYADVDPCYAAGRLFEVEFEAVGQVPEGESFVEIPVELEVADLRNYEDYRIEPSVSQGKITLTNTPYGDINGSNDTTATDALMTLYANSQLLELTDEQKLLADVNGDGKVSAADALLILQYSAGDISNYPIFTIAAPKGLNVVSKDESSITFSWEEVKLSAGYNLYMDGVRVNTSLITENGYTVDGLEQNTQHTFAVSAVNVLKETEQSESVVVSTNRADRQVTFKDHDGTILNTQIVLSGQAAVEPAAPVREGYTFIGWDKDTTEILEDTVFTAQYQINTYTVTFDYLYNSKTATASAVYQTLVSEPSVISRTDYTLEGWYRDKNFVQKWDFASSCVTGNITLYANWVTWSGWSTDTSLLNNSLYEVQSKTQYAYSDKSTTTTSTDTLAGGWTYDGYTTKYTPWIDGAWTSTMPTKTDLLAITDSRTVTDSPAYTKYHYFHYKYWNSSAGTYYYTWDAGSGGEYYEFTTTSPITIDYYTGGYAMTVPYEGHRWFLFKTEEVPAVTHTEWFYVTRSKVYTYHWYKWSAYSDWSDTAYSASSTRQVKTRTVYRYKLKQQ